MDRLVAMETFVGVFEAGSFSAAARRLGLGQPSVSKTIAQLEERLGVRLLMRSTRGLTPTEAGTAYYERALRAINEAQEAEAAARGAGTGLQGTLRVCAAVTFARLHILPRLGEFLARHPDLQVDIILDDRLVNLVEEGIDVALRMGNLPDSSLTARSWSWRHRPTWLSMVRPLPLLIWCTTRPWSMHNREGVSTGCSARAAQCSR